MQTSTSERPALKLFQCHYYAAFTELLKYLILYMYWCSCESDYNLSSLPKVYYRRCSPPYLLLLRKRLRVDGFALLGRRASATAKCLLRICRGKINVLRISLHRGQAQVGAVGPNFN